MTAQPQEPRKRRILNQPMLGIKQFREKMSLSQEGLGKQLGVHASSISLWELGKTRPTAAYTRRLMVIFDCTEDELTYGATIKRATPVEVGTQVKLKQQRKSRDKKVPFEGLRTMRIEAKLEQKQLAELIGVGSTRISGWERGKAYPFQQFIDKMMDLFACTEDELIHGRKPAEIPTEPKAPQLVVNRPSPVPFVTHKTIIEHVYADAKPEPKPPIQYPRQAEVDNAKKTTSTVPSTMAIDISQLFNSPAPTAVPQPIATPAPKTAPEPTPVPSFTVTSPQVVFTPPANQPSQTNELQIAIIAQEFYKQLKNIIKNDNENEILRNQIMDLRKQLEASTSANLKLAEQIDIMAKLNMERYRR